MDNVVVPKEKAGIVAAARVEEAQVIEQYREGLLSEDEKYLKVISIWEGAKLKIQEAIPASMDPNGPAADMINSQARGSMGQLVQMSGMKGLMTNTVGRIIDFPIVPSYKEGLSPLEYFITTHGSRKGLADTALKTASAGYLTRRLVDVSQDVVVTEEDCKTKNGKVMKEENISGLIIPLSKNIMGRTLGEDLKDHRRKSFVQEKPYCYKRRS
jgi:DNA-directed RNA polymerase subunit beta'